MSARKPVIPTLPPHTTPLPNMSSAPILDPPSLLRLELVEGPEALRLRHLAVQAGGVEAEVAQ